MELTAVVSKPRATVYARALDYVQFDAPGKKGQPIVGEAVYEVTLQPGDGSPDWEWGGRGLDWRINQQPPAGGIVRYAIGGSFGEVREWQIGIIVRNLESGSLAQRKVTVKFLRFEALPEGTTIRSCTNSSWFNP